MAALELSTPEQAFEQFVLAVSDSLPFEHVDSVAVGPWADPNVYLPVGNSEITAPFMEAFIVTQRVLYQLVAELKYGVPDARKLSDEDIEKYRISVRVLPGSSQYIQELSSAFEKLVEEAVGKLSANQIVALIAGGFLLFGGSAGFSTYLEYRKEIRLAEIASADKKAELEAQKYATKQQMDMTKFVAQKMSEQSQVTAQAVKAAQESNQALLRAISTTPSATVNGVHLSKSEAEALHHNKRRRADEQVIERLMKVVDINTSDRTSTSVELSGYGKENIKVTFADRLIEERDLSKLHNSLKRRKQVRVKLLVRKVGGEIKSAEILSVVTPRKRT